MLVLAVETSSARGSLALAEVTSSVRILGETVWLRGKSHSELISATAEELLASSGKSVRDLNGLAVSVGPGSFTGIRVGISFTKSLSFALNIPVWPVDSLKVWAQPLWDSEYPVVVAVHGFRDLIYTTHYSKVKSSARETIRATDVQTFDQLIKTFPPGEVALAGDAHAKFSDQWPASLKNSVKKISEDLPLAKHLLHDLVESGTRTKGTSWQNVNPLYIRGSEAEEKLRQGLLKPVPKL